MGEPRSLYDGGVDPSGSMILLIRSILQNKPDARDGR